ncbi:hypothetical protein [Pararhodonellum marinum]|uniref:hypothetical protein n=1 Tax=Pararhodonellum marinum TaxID=2755358 RepID=UPI00188F00E5|nr:hypothetical protein [Pararhodonellum marinum]
MNKDLITQILQEYFVSKGKSLKVIHRYLRVKYRMHIELALLEKRVQSLLVP